MKGRIFTIVKYVFFLGLGVGLLYLAFRNTNPHEMLREIRSADYFWVAMSVLAGVVAYYSRAARWLIVLEPLGYKPRLSTSLYSVFFGYFANIAAPRVGELARCTALNQTEKIPLNALIGTVILERAIDVVLLFLLMLTAFFLNTGLFGGFFQDIFREKLQSAQNMTLVFLLLGFMVLICLFLFFFRKRIMQFSFAEKVKTFLKGVFDGIAAIGKMKRKWLFVFHTAIIWVSYITMTYLGFFALSQTMHLSIADGIFITVVGGIGMAVPSNGGIGTYHAAVMFGLAAIGIDNNVGLAYATIMHASQALFIIVTGAFSFVMLYIEKNKRLADDAINHSADEKKINQ